MSVYQARRVNAIRKSSPQISDEETLSRIRGDWFAANKFVDLAHEKLRYVTELGWLVYEGGVWRQDDDEARKIVMEAVGGTLRNAAVDYSNLKASAEIASALYRRATYYETTRGAEQLLVAMRGLLRWHIEELDTDPYTLNFKNGTLDMGVWRIAGDDSMGVEWKQHHHDDRLTKIIPHDYEPFATAPKWEQFLQDIFPDPELRDFIKRAAGYSLTGSTTEQKLFICYGTGANGKSTFLNTLQKAIGGGYSQTASPATFLAGRENEIRNDIATLRGVRLVPSIETGDGRRLNEDLVKAVTGGDSVRCRFLYRESFEYIPEFKLWLATNHKPQIWGTDYAIWRRILLVPFTTTIPVEKMDPDLPKKLAREYPGILAWAVQGFRDYIKQGLTVSKAVQVATEEYRVNEDVIGQFLAECCDEWEFAQVKAAELYEAFLKWGGTMKQTAFGRKMTERNYKRGTVDNARTYIGLRLKSTPHEA